MSSILAARRGGGEERREVKTVDNWVMMRRGLGARESQSDTERVTRLPAREKTANRTKKGEKISAPTKHWIYGYFFCFTSSHGQKKTKRIITQYFPYSPSLPRHHSQVSPWSPPFFQMWQHSTTPLTRTKLPADPPKSFCLSYILLQRDRREARPSRDRSNYHPMMIWQCLCCHHCIVTIVIHLDISPAIITAQWHLMSLPLCCHLLLANISWEQRQRMF